MSTEDVVSEARAHLKRLDDAAEEARRVRYEHPAVAMRACSERNAAHNALDTHGPRIVAGLLAVIDEQRTRLDALAPLEQAADEHELTALRLADAQARVARLEEVVTAHVGEVRRQCARIEELETELASRPLALARGER